MSFRQTPYGKITSDWEIKKASEYLTVLTDYVANGSFASLKNNVQYYSEPNYAILLRLTDYNNSYKGDFVYIDEKGYNFLSKTKLYGGEIIISNVGANVGTVFKAPRLELKMNLGPNTIMIKTQGNDDFYYYWFKSPQGQAQIKAILSGSAQPKFNKTAFKNIELPIPSLSEQKAIADILSSLDEKIELNNQMNETLEEMAQALFKRWFVDFEFPNEEGQPYKSSGGEMVESELGMIPKGWNVVTLDEITSKFNTGLNPRKNFKLGSGNNYYVTIKNMRNQQVYLDDKCDRIDDDAIKIINKRSDLKIGDILFSGIGTIGRVCYICSEPYNWNISESIFTLRANEKITSYFLYLLLISENVQNYAKQLASGSVQKGIRMGDLKKYTLVIPNQEKIYNLSSAVKPLIERIHLNNKETIELCSLRDTLLPKLMSGEIRVSDLKS